VCKTVAESDAERDRRREVPRTSSWLTLNFTISDPPWIDSRSIRVELTIKVVERSLKSEASNCARASDPSGMAAIVAPSASSIITGAPGPVQSWTNLRTHTVR